MLTRRRTLALAAAGTLAPFAAPAIAQPRYPNKPITLIVSYAAGGGTDAVARIFAARLEQVLDGRVIVENRPGAAANLGTEAVAAAAPDGYTLLIGNQGPMVVNPHLFRRLKADPATTLDPIAMIAVGVLLSCVGTDLETGRERLTFGLDLLYDGFEFVVIAMGLFGFAEILKNLANPEARDVVRTKIGRLLPTFGELRANLPPMLRGTTLGSALGILPGNGAILGPFASYALEKRLSKEPGRFGRGAPAGVAGPESANNAGAQTSFIPLLTLGLPPNAVMALMVGAMLIQGVIPGPQVIDRNPQLFWGLIASMWIGNMMLLIINLPLIGLWVRLLSVPYRLLFPAIVLFCCIGIFSISNKPEQLMITAAFGLFGYLLHKLEFEAAPLALGFVLGQLLEEKMRQALIISNGDPTVFVATPLSGTLLAVGLSALVLAVLPSMRRSREEVFRED